MFIEVIPHRSANGTLSSWLRSQIDIVTGVKGHSGIVVIPGWSTQGPYLLQAHI